MQDLQKTAWGQLASPLKRADPHGAALVFRPLASPPTEATRLPIGAALNGVDGPSRPTATRFSIDAGGRTASGCWRPLRRRSWGRRWSQAAGKIEPLVLPHAYSHLAPMAGVA